MWSGSVKESTSWVSKEDWELNYGLGCWCSEIELIWWGAE